MAGPDGHPDGDWWLRPKLRRAAPTAGSRFRKYRVPGGRSRRTLAVLRRATILRPRRRLELRPCHACGCRRRLGTEYLVPRKWRGAAERTARRRFYCQPCWLGWRVAMNRWFVEECRRRWDDNFGAAEAGEAEGHFHFVEVGTSSYHTFTQAVAGHPDEKPFAWKFLPWDRHPLQIRGLAVDMQQRYLDQLPDCPRVAKRHAAVSEEDGFQRMYSVPLGDVERWEKIFATCGSWRGHSSMRLARGCSALRAHSGMRNVLRRVGLQHLGRVRRVPTCTIDSLFREQGVRSVGVLALDCEGHDCAILRGLLRACDARPEWFPEWIWFESNGLNDELFGRDTEKRTVEEFVRRGYAVWWGGGFRQTGQRDTLLQWRGWEAPPASGSSAESP